MAINRMKTRQFPRILAPFALLCASLWSGALLAQDCTVFADRIGISSGADARVTLDANEAVADDREAIECAVQAAADNGIGRVQLQEGEFYLSQLELTDFIGSLEGRSIASTRLNAIPGSIDCAADSSAGKDSAFIRFVGGQPRLRTMTILGGASCFDDNVLDSLVHFTGQDAFAECGNDLTQGVVDRVVMEGPGIGGGVYAAITAWAQGFEFFTCRNTLLGTFKVNRSVISGFDLAIGTSMQGSAQVDINFNEISDTLGGYTMERSRQITSVTLNEFNGSPAANQLYYSIRALAGSDAPDKTALTVSGNIFNVDSSQSNNFPAGGVLTSGFGQGASLSLVAKENTFNLVSGAEQGLFLIDVSNAVVIDNRFNGGFRAVAIQKINANAVSDNAILANRVDDDRINFQVGPGVARTIIGPGQNALVLDQGNGTILTDNSALAEPAAMH